MTARAKWDQGMKKRSCLSNWWVFKQTALRLGYFSFIPSSSFESVQLLNFGILYHVVDTDGRR